MSGEKQNNLIPTWEELTEQKLPVEDLEKIMEKAAIPSRGFCMMLILATCISTFGLLSNSAATIIGAMIVAPLMNPIVALSYSLTAFKKRIFIRSICTILMGTAITFFISALIAASMDWRIFSSQIQSRMEPTSMDLGVAIISGLAAAYAYSRASIANSLAGVAIAVALVPPLCVSGISFAIQNNSAPDIGLKQIQDGGLGAFLLYLANLIGIIVASGLVFFFQYQIDRKRVLLRLLIPWTLMLLLISIPLTRQFSTVQVKHRITQFVFKLASDARKEHRQKELFDYKYKDVDPENPTVDIDEAQEPDLFYYLKDFRVEFLYAEIEEDHIYVIGEVAGPPESYTHELSDKLCERLSKEFGTKVVLRIRVIPVDDYTISVEQNKIKLMVADFVDEVTRPDVHEIVKPEDIYRTKTIEVDVYKKFIDVYVKEFEGVHQIISEKEVKALGDQISMEFNNKVRIRFNAYPVEKLVYISEAYLNPESAIRLEDIKAEKESSQDGNSEPAEKNAITENPIPTLEQLEKEISAPE